MFSLTTLAPTSGRYTTMSSNTSLSSNSPVSTNSPAHFALTQGLVSTVAPDYKYLGKVQLNNDVNVGQNSATLDDRSIPLTVGMGLKFGETIYIISKVTSSYDKDNFKNNTTVELKANVQSSVPGNSSIFVYTETNAQTTSPASSVTPTKNSLSNYTYSSVPTTTYAPVDAPTSSSTTTTYAPVDAPTSSSTTTTNRKETFIEGAAGDSSTSAPTLTQEQQITTTNSPNFFNFLNTSAQTPMPSPTPTPTPTLTISDSGKIYILHLSNTSTINSALIFTSYTNVSTDDLKRISSEIQTTPDLFTLQEGVDVTQSGLPDFNSCANTNVASSNVTHPPISFSTSSVLYITDCVYYPIYSASYKNDKLILQLNTNDDRTINAGYYRLSI
jgi:hypothetical protein